MSKTAEQYAAEARSNLPEPGDSPLQHLRHTIAAFINGADPDDFVVMATDGIYPQGRTGITWDDLVQILDWLEKSEEHLAPKHSVFGR